MAKRRTKMHTAEEAMHERIMQDLDDATDMATGDFTSTSFFKKKKGKNIFRIVKPLEGPFCIPFKEHRGGSRQNFRTALDLGFLYHPKREELRKEMEARKRISGEDYDMFTEFGGDPGLVIFKSLKALGKEDLWKNIVRQRVWFLIVADSQDEEDEEESLEFYVFDASPSFAETFKELYKSDPSIIDPIEGSDICLVGKGDGFGKKNPRRYIGPTIHSEPYNLGVEEDDFINLYDRIAGKVLSYPDKVDFMLTHHSKLARAAGLTYSDFGCEEPEEEEEDEDIEFEDDEEEEDV